MHYLKQLFMLPLSILLVPYIVYLWKKRMEGSVLAPEAKKHILAITIYEVANVRIGDLHGYILNGLIWSGIIYLIFR